MRLWILSGGALNRVTVLDPHSRLMSFGNSFDLIVIGMKELTWKVKQNTMSCRGSEISQDEIWAAMEGMYQYEGVCLYVFL